MFGDGGIFVASIDGHAKGQACLFMPDYHLFIAADLCWGIDLLPYTKKMHLIPSLVQDSKADYIKGTELLEEVLKDGIEVLVSHDPVERIERILYEKITFLKTFNPHFVLHNFKSRKALENYQKKQLAAYMDFLKRESPYLKMVYLTTLAIWIKHL